MPTPGPEVLRRIAESEAQARKIEADSRQSAQEAAKAVDDLVAGQTTTLRELAQLYLPSLSTDTRRQGWTEMQATVRDIMLRKEDAQRRAKTAVEAAVAVRQAAEGRWNAACDRVNQLTAQCDAIAKQITQQMSTDQEFQTLARRAAEGQARLEQAEANLEEVERDAKDKLPKYDQSKLFKYLHQRQYGKAAYSYRGMTRSLDRWVAQMIDYPKAAAGYHFLTTTPGQMRQLISEQRTAVQSTVAEVESRQAALASSLGLPRAQAEGTQARADQDEAALAVERAREQEASSRTALSKLDGDQCPFYDEAVAVFQKLLERTERTLLESRAAQTPELTDDQIVARLKHLDYEITERRRLLAERTRTADMASQRADAFSQLATRFRRAQYDHPRSLFDDEFDVEGQLWAILDGTTDVERVWQFMRRYHKLGPTVAEQTAAALQHPMTQILVQTMAQAAGAALGNYAARASQQSRSRRDHRDWF